MGSCATPGGSHCSFWNSHTSDRRRSRSGELSTGAWSAHISVGLRVAPAIPCGITGGGDGALPLFDLPLFLPLPCGCGRGRGVSPGTTSGSWLMYLSPTVLKALRAGRGISVSGDVVTVMAHAHLTLLYSSAARLRRQPTGVGALRSVALALAQSLHMC